MSTKRNVLLVVSTACALVLVGCTQPPPLPDPVLTPAGPVVVPVNGTVEFEVDNLEDGVDWSVDGVLGGTAATGTISDGTYQAPPRIPTGSTVAVTASDAKDPARSADAEVTITAQGTLYILDDQVYVYNRMGETSGNVAPDRTFSVDAITGDYFDMTIAPAVDVAFISAFQASPSLFRVDAVSTATGTVEGSAIDTLGNITLGLAYDPQRDILYAVSDSGIMVFEDATVMPAGQPPARVLSGPNVEFVYEDGDSRLSLDPGSDRLFIVSPEMGIAVYESASTVDGDKAPDRTVLIDAPYTYFWGSAYDASRDELYLGDNEDGVGIYVLADASTAEGLTPPARSIGGPTNLLERPSQIGYDVANDRLAVLESVGNQVKVFDSASTLDGDVPPTRVIGGSELPINYAYSGYLDPTQ